MVTFRDCVGCADAICVDVRSQDLCDVRIAVCYCEKVKRARRAIYGWRYGGAVSGLGMDGKVVVIVQSFSEAAVETMQMLLKPVNKGKRSSGPSEQRRGERD